MLGACKELRSMFYQVIIFKLYAILLVFIATILFLILTTNFIRAIQLLSYIAARVPYKDVNGKERDDKLQI